MTKAWLMLVHIVLTQPQGEPVTLTLGMTRDYNSYSECLSDINNQKKSFPSEYILDCKRRVK
jgi:hypothetical protein